MNYSSVIKKSVFFGLFSKVSQIVYGFLSIPLILGSLSSYEYGIWIIIGQLIALSYFLDMGIGNSFSRFLTRFRNKHMGYSINKLFSTAFFYLAGLSFIILILSIFLSQFVLQIYGLSDAEASKFGSIFSIAIVFAMSILPLRIFTGVYLSLHRLHTLDIIVSLIAFLKLGLIFLMSNLKILSIDLLVLIVYGLELLSFVFLYIYAKKFISFSFSYKFFSIKMLKLIFSFSIYNILYSFILFLFLQYPIFLISKYITIEDVMLFSIPSMIIVSISAILGRVGTVFSPISIELNKNDRVQLNIMLVKYSNIIALISFCTFLLFYFFGQSLLSLWLNDLSLEQIKQMNIVLLAISFPYLSFVGFIGYKNTLFTNGYHKTIVKSNLFLLLLVILFTVISIDFLSIIFGFVILSILLVASFLVKAKEYFYISLIAILKQNILYFILLILYLILMALEINS